MMRVLVTRAEPAASRTAELLKKAGHKAVKLPLFEIRDTGQEIPEDDFDGYIFTSSNACAILEERGWKPRDSQKSVFCVGEKTANRAKNLGFQNVVFEQGGALKLIPRIISTGLPKNANLLYFTTPDRSFNLQSHLAEHNLLVTNLDIYRAELLDILPTILQSRFEQAMPDAILTYSKRSSDILADLLANTALKKDLSQIQLISISEVAIGNLNRFQWNEIVCPPVANEQAMLHILDK